MAGVESDGDCLIWTGSTAGRGYGTIRRSDGPGILYAHRVVWEHHHGTIPDGTEIDHVCRQRLCANIDHLRLVSHDENMRRKNLTAEEHRRL